MPHDFRTVKFDTKQSCTNLRCLVKSDGSVLAVPSCDFSARCEADYTDWPLDTQRCRMLFGAWMEHAGEVDYHTRFACLGSEQSNLHTQWRVVSAKKIKKEISYNNVTYPTLMYDYVLERHSGIHLAGILTPIIRKISYLGMVCERILSVIAIYFSFNHDESIPHMAQNGFP